MSAATALLTTKLYIPPARPDRVPRLRLLTRLSQALKHPLTLVCAPAGFGKTTLISEWIALDQRRCAWLSLDAGDNTPARFWSYVIAAFQTLKSDLGESALSLLQSPQPPALEPILTLLLNDVAAFEEEAVIVLDDYHMIDNVALHNGLTYLIEHWPPASMHLLISTRIDPPIPLARLRARAQLTELRADDLRFTPDEVSTFLNNAMGLNLSTDDIAALEGRTEGWIAGLQLAALSMQGRDDIQGFIKAFSGSHRHVLSYLIEEVLSQRPAGTLDFLLQTSILDRLCGSLCDAVCDGSDGQTILEQLEHANLFLTSLDDERMWYRYHQLFADVLRARLRQTVPQQVNELHQRASIWHAENGYMAEAIHHAFAAADFDRAARLVEESAWQMLGRGDLSTLQTWLDTLPGDVVQTRPRLSLVYAMIMSITNQLAALERRLQDAEHALAVETTLDDHDVLLGHVAALRAHLAFEQNDLPRSIELCRQALQRIPEDNALMRSLAMYYLGNAQRRSDDISGAIETLTQGSQLARAAGNPLLALNNLGTKAILERAQGKLQASEETNRQSLQLAAETHSHPFAALPHIGLGRLLREWNDLESATQHLQESIDLGQRWGLKDIEVHACLGLAPVRQAQGDRAGARALIEQAAQVARDWNRSAVVRLVDHHAARLDLAQGMLDRAARWAESSGLDPNAADLSFRRESEYLSLARVRIAQDRSDEALHVLDRLLRFAEDAQRIGSMIEILMLRALAYHAQDNTADAITSLERALMLAKSEGYIRLFVDEGESMRLLLKRLETRNLRLEGYVSRLLSAYTDTTFQSPISNLQSLLVDPLSERELEVVRLVADGFNNREIAEKLFIGVNTIKTHINNIYRKLDVKSRTQAVARARELGLL